MERRLNVIILHADQLRAQALGYAGDPNARTPRLDALARESANLSNAVSCCPLCSPARASLLTGQYPLSHRVIVNDVHLGTGAPSIARAFKDAGYDTGYIGKWHLDGTGGRSAFIPRERRQDFDYWSVLECTHDYFKSKYWGNDDELHEWKGYDAIAQSRAAQGYIKARTSDPNPFFLVVSWGPPHDPYKAVPWRYKRGFPPRRIELRPNVPADARSRARNDSSGYYAHVSALDDCCGMVLDAVKVAGIEDRTIVVFTADHGDMLGSHGFRGKQAPWDESIRIPLLVKDPRIPGCKGRTIEQPVNVPDIMPTLLSMCGVAIPGSVEGRDFSGVVRGDDDAQDEAALFASYSPICNWHETGREYRGIRTMRYTYVRSLQGPWLLYDNSTDPFQLDNLIGRTRFVDVQVELDARLDAALRRTGDDFRPRTEYLERFGYRVGPDGAVPYKN
ncbi:MAG: sulfatase [Candidatus Lokiarchaeota archaeon]|nr:sulfatase [Candidatus Lokiarchaeota archaeon]